MAKLAIVGAGIGGCLAAYFVHKYLPNQNVTIYDSQNRIGGRIQTYNQSGVTIELGAVFFNRFNKTLLDIIKAERLKIAPLEGPKDFAVWNGSKIVFRSNKQSFACLANMNSCCYRTKSTAVNSHTMHHHKYNKPLPDFVL